jgi:hypothetical protein
MPCVGIDRPYKREFVKERLPSFEKKPRRYRAWLCTKAVSHLDVAFEWPKKRHYEAVFEVFKAFYPEMIEWFEGRNDCSLKWGEATSLIDRPLVVIFVEGSLAGIRRFEEAWKAYVETNMVFFGHGHDFEGMTIAQRHLRSKFREPRLFRNVVSAFFPYTVVVPRSESASRTISDARPYELASPLKGPVFVINEVAPYHCRTRFESDVVLLKLMS